MAVTFKVDVVSPEKVLFSGEADMVITRTLEGGEVAFQNGHAPFLLSVLTTRLAVGALVENHTRIFLSDGTVKDVAVHRGFVEVSGTPTTISILSDTAELAEEIDVDRAREALERHQKVLRAETNQSELTDALAGAARAQARLTATNTPWGFPA